MITFIIRVPRINTKTNMFVIATRTYYVDNDSLLTTGINSITETLRLEGLDLEKDLALINKVLLKYQKHPDKVKDMKFTLSFSKDRKTIDVVKAS